MLDSDNVGKSEYTPTPSSNGLDSFKTWSLVLLWKHPLRHTQGKSQDQPA